MMEGSRPTLTQPNLNAKQARWLATLSELGFEIRYIKGKENQVADVLLGKLVSIQSY